MLKGGSAVDEKMVEVEQRPHVACVHRSSGDRSVLVVGNGRASGVASGGQRLIEGIASAVRAHGLPVEATVTHDEEDLEGVFAAAEGRRVVLVGGDGSLHAALNTRLLELPELALVPAGRANNVARALGIPTDPAAAVAVAVHGVARPLDALRAVTPDRSLFALEAVSGGFQAEARGRYAADNSAHLRQGLAALATAVRDYEPYRLEMQLDDREIVAPGAAQLFLSNLPFFGFGFNVDPGADPADGQLDAVLIEASSRRALLGHLAAAYRGRHIGRAGVRRISARRAVLTAPLPLVADSVALGTVTATVTVEPGRMRLVMPVPDARR